MSEFFPAPAGLMCSSVQTLAHPRRNAGAICAPQEVQFWRILVQQRLRKNAGYCCPLLHVIEFLLKFFRARLERSAYAEWRMLTPATQFP